VVDKGKKIEVGMRRSEVGMRKSEYRSRNAEVGIRKSECGSRNAEVGMRKSEYGRWKKRKVRGREGRGKFRHCRINAKPSNFKASNDRLTVFADQFAFNFVSYEWLLAVIFDPGVFFVEITPDMIILNKV
jgi:hypothetical protein